jgi:V/A-type H+-transporting ATPase subunit D
MELTKLKRQLATATRGHKLLKDKQDELMRQFINMIQQNHQLRLEVEEKLEEAFKDFLLARSVMSSEFLEESISFPKEHVSVDIQTRNIMSVIVPVINYQWEHQNEGSIYPYGFASTTGELDSAIGELSDCLPQLMELAQVEKSCQLMSDEIEKTRRRVNALEYRTIPSLNETIRFINMKLDESERSARVRLMKVKDIVGG